MHKFHHQNQFKLYANNLPLFDDDTILFFENRFDHLFQKLPLILCSPYLHAYHIYLVFMAWNRFQMFSKDGNRYFESKTHGIEYTEFWIISLFTLSLKCFYDILQVSSSNINIIHAYDLSPISFKHDSILAS